jgi:hypothetical protein
MRSRRPVAVTLVALTAGLAASAVLRRLAARRRPARAASTAPATAPVVTAPVAPEAPAAQPADRDAVVLAFARRTVTEPAAARPATPARCGDSGGRTKAGAPCAARATGGGRCHHHRIAA